ncbi:MAG: response regulator, partial [Chitinophagales bacterium]
MSKLNCVLLVEDEPVTNFLHRIVVQDANCTEEIVIKENGQEALDYLLDSACTTPEIIFLDLNMPIMNGWEFLEEYSKIHKSARAKAVIITLSTSLEDSDYKRAHDLKVV